MLTRIFNKYPLLILLFFFFIINIVILSNVPLYGDELSFAEYIPVYQTRFHQYFIDNFMQYKFYRVLGNPLCYIGAYISHGSPLKLSAIFTVTAMLLIAGYSHLYAKCFMQRKNLSYILTGILCLSFPFSYYIVIARAGYHELVTLSLVLMCIYSTSRYVQTDKRQYMFIAVFVYFISLYVYEASLMMSLYLVIFVASQVTKKRFLSSRNLSFAVLLLIGMMVYLYHQFSYLQSQPKLSDSMAIYAPYNVGLTIKEQLLRVVLYFAYHVKWSLYYLYNFSTSITLVDTCLIAVFILLTATVLWRSLSNPLTYPDREVSRSLIFNGISLFVCSFGLWAYYWIFKKSIVLPPFYNFLLPAIGISVALTGWISLFSVRITSNRVLKSFVFAIIITAFTTNIIFFLSSRLAIINSVNEIQGYARLINDKYGLQAQQFKNIVLLDLPVESGYARRKGRYEYSLIMSLNKLNPNWKQLSIISNVCKNDADEKITISPYMIPVKVDDLLIVSYNQDHHDFERRGPSSCADALKQSKSDPCKLGFMNYEISYSTEKENIIMRKRL